MDLSKEIQYTIKADKSRKDTYVVDLSLEHSDVKDSLVIHSSGFEDGKAFVVGNEVLIHNFIYDFVKDKCEIKCEDDDVKTFSNNVCDVVEYVVNKKFF